ncbi:unnamed protein product [Discula destructiva]
MTDRYGHPRQSIFPPGRRHASATASVAYSTSQQQQQQHPPHHYQSQQQHQQQQQQQQQQQHPQAHPPAAPAKPPRSNHLQFRSSSQLAAPRRLAPRGLLLLDGAVDSDGDTMVVEDYYCRGFGLEDPYVDDGDGDGDGDGDDDDDDDDRAFGEQGIVVRNSNGDYEVEEPPSMVVDDPDEIVLDMRQENEKERQRLADAVKQHQSQQNSVPAQPEELLEAVKASLRAKVAALAEDKWMYEKEEELHSL